MGAMWIRSDVFLRAAPRRSRRVEQLPFFDALKQQLRERLGAIWRAWGGRLVGGEALGVPFGRPGIHDRRGDRLQWVLRSDGLASPEGAILASCGIEWQDQWDLISISLEAEI